MTANGTELYGGIADSYTPAGVLVTPSDQVTHDDVLAVAVASDVCIRPLVREVHDALTDATHRVTLACGSTRERTCPSCAAKSRRLRMHQCREGWHLNADPPARASSTSPGQNPPSSPADPSGRVVRSTRRLGGKAELPKVPMEERTIGRTYTDPRTGRTFRPSMFLTLTLASYGRIVRGEGVPEDPDSYDYRRAAFDALLFSRLVDRFWQNLRRCAGFKVQYFSAVEAQRRLAPHLHAAIRGAIPRSTLREVARATYFAAWWPSIEHVVYGESDLLPFWDSGTQIYVDAATGEPLPTWDDSVRTIEAPCHVVEFGAQLDIKGLLGGTAVSDRAVRYLCKYLTKSIAETYADEPSGVGAAYERHIMRLHEHVRLLPCSPQCANWIRYGVTPKDPGPGLRPGACASAAHDRENLGLGGRRVLVSRQWSGKTLGDHRADRRTVVAETLAAAGVDAEEAGRMAADQVLPDGSPRFTWTEVEVSATDYVSVMTTSLRQARLWREQYQAAKDLALQRGSPVETNSAIGAA